MDGRKEDLGTSWLLKKQLKNNPKEGDDDTSTPGKPGIDTTQTSNAEQQAPITHTIEAEDRIRVLAYSDSDSDVESHVKRVQDHLLPGLDKSNTANSTDTDGSATTAAAAETDLTSNQQQYPRQSNKGLAALLSAAGSALRGTIHCITPGLVIRTAAFHFLRMMNPRASQTAEITAGIAGSVALLSHQRRLSRGESGSSSVVQIIELGKAAVALSVLRYMKNFHENMLKGRVFRLTSGVDVSALDEAVPFDPDNPPQSSTEWAAVYRPEMREMKRMLMECGIDLPQPRFNSTNAECMRFAIACGLLDAQTPQERGDAIEKAVRRIILACEWLSMQEKLSDSKLRKWERLVAWRGADAAGRKILVIRLGRALQLCTRAGQLETFAKAVAAQIEKGVAPAAENQDGEGVSSAALSSTPAILDGGPDHIIAVVDCRETSNWEALLHSRDAVSLAKRLASDVAMHYPGRLEKVYILELPLLARMGLQSVVAPLPQSVKDKIVPASENDESMPITIALLQKKRSFAKGLTRTMSDISMATSECSTVAGDKHEDEEEEEREGKEEGGENTVTGRGSGVDAATETSIDHENASTTTTTLMSVVAREKTPSAESTATPFLAEKSDAPGSQFESEEGAEGHREDIEQASTWTDMKTACTAQEEERRSPVSAGGNGVATNLIDAMDAAAKPLHGDSIASPSLDASPWSPADPALESNDMHDVMSHALSLTPNTLSPRSTPESEAWQSMLSSIGLPVPWSGAFALLQSLVVQPSAIENARFTRGSRHAPRFLAAASGGAAGKRGDTMVSPMIKGGLIELPPRPLLHQALDTLDTTATAAPPPNSNNNNGDNTALHANNKESKIDARTPSKSSLRNASSSNETPRVTVPPLGSFPLRRQTSVSWAEDLERVREIRRSRDILQMMGRKEGTNEHVSTPSPTLASTSTSLVHLTTTTTTTTVSPSSTVSLASAVSDIDDDSFVELVSSPFFSSIVVALMCAGMLQRVLVC